MAKRRSQAWKALEREAAEHSGGTRVYRGADFSVKDVDVQVPDLSFLQIDAKYRVRHGHHRFMQDIEEKYCKNPEDEPVMFSKTHGQHCCYATVRGTFLEFLLEVLRAFANGESASESGAQVQSNRSTGRGGVSVHRSSQGRLPDDDILRRSRATLEKLRAVNK